MEERKKGSRLLSSRTGTSAGRDVVLTENGRGKREKELEGSGRKVF